jgi:UDP-N-acetylglucosamine acyltransferase
MNAFTKATDAITSVLPFRSVRPAKPAPRISPLAVVDPRASIAEGCEIGPFCIVGPDVTLGANNKLLSHVVITGHTTIGRDNIFHPHCVIGGPPQDKKYKDEPTGLKIGDRNILREAVTLHVGTVQGGKIFGGGITRVGDDNLLMVNFHAGHDVQIGSRCILANNTMLAGHVIVGDNVVLNGNVGVSSFVTIDDFSYVAGFARLNHDIPPFVKVAGQEGAIRALNAVGLKRGGFADADIEALDDAVRKLFGGRIPQARAIAEFDASNGLNPHVKRLIDFLRKRDTGRHGRYLESLRK